MIIALVSTKSDKKKYISIPQNTLSFALYLKDNGMLRSPLLHSFNMNANEVKTFEDVCVSFVITKEGFEFQFLCCSDTWKPEKSNFHIVQSENHEKEKSA